MKTKARLFEIPDISKFIRNLVLIILYVTPFVFIPIGLYNDYFYEPKLLFYQLIVSVFLFALLIHRKVFVKKLKFDNIDKVLLIFLISLIVSTIFALDPKLAILGSPRRVEGLNAMLTYLILFMMARHMAPLKKKHIKTILVLSLIIVLYGILQTHGLDPFSRDFIRQDWKIAFSTIGNPNFLGSFIVLLLPFATDYYIRFKDKWALLIYGILFYGLLATMTRGTWIGGFFAILIYLGILYFKKQLDYRRLLIFVAVNLLVVFLFVGVSGDAFLLRLLSIQKDMSKLIENEAIEEVGSSRMFIWIRAVELFKMRPFFGYGLENVGNAFLKFYRQDILDYFNYLIVPDKAHNEYLHYALVGGLFTLITYLSLITLIIKSNLKRAFKSSYGLPLMISIVGYLIQATFNISVVSVAYIFWIFLGWSVNHAETDNDSLLVQHE